jgi:hypothetical protein
MIRANRPSLSESEKQQRREARLALLLSFLIFTAVLAYCALTHK